MSKTDASSERISEEALINAAAFIRALPVGIPIPEFASEPDGMISLDWITSHRRVFSVSIGTSRRLAFAWLDGTDTGHGVARFDGAAIPRKILDGILQIIDHGNPTFRPA